MDDQMERDFLEAEARVYEWLIREGIAETLRQMAEERDREKGV
jgi:hypothetical protein